MAPEHRCCSSIRYSQYVSVLFADNLLDLVSNLLDLLLGSINALLQSQLLLSTPVVVVQVSVTLCELGALVDEVAAKEEVVGGGNGEGVAHESRRVNDESTGHLARNPIGQMLEKGVFNKRAG